MRSQIESIIALILLIITFLFIYNQFKTFVISFYNKITELKEKILLEYELIRIIIKSKKPYCFYPFLFPTDRIYTNCSTNHLCFSYNGTHFVIKGYANITLAVLAKDTDLPSKPILKFPYSLSGKYTYLVNYSIFTEVKGNYAFYIKNGIIIIDHMETNDTFFEINGTLFPLCKTRPNILYDYNGILLLIPITEA